jgi:hypothetical protein
LPVPEGPAAIAALREQGSLRITYQPVRRRRGRALFSILPQRGCRRDEFDSSCKGSHKFIGVTPGNHHNRRRNAMTNSVRPYEPLTSQNAALILVDHQIGLMTDVRDYSTGELKHNVVALAKAAKVLKLPIVVTTTARDSMWGPTFPELVEALAGIEIIDRSSVNAFDDTRVARAIEATGRKKLIFAGISLEVCAAFPAMTAVVKGSTPMWQSMPREHSARPSGKLGSCACCRRALFSRTTRP